MSSSRSWYLILLRVLETLKQAPYANFTNYLSIYLKRQRNKQWMIFTCLKIVSNEYLSLICQMTFCPKIMSNDFLLINTGII